LGAAAMAMDHRLMGMRFSYPLASIRVMLRKLGNQT